MIPLSVFSAMLFALSLPNEVFLMGFWPLGFVALAPFYLALKRAGTPGRAAAAGAVFGLVNHCLTSYWLFFYKGYAFWTLGTTALAYAILYAVVGMYANFILRNERPAYRPFVFAAGWAAFEYLKSTGFLGYPWGLLPYSLTSVPVLLQSADVLGVYGDSFLLALASSVLAEALDFSEGTRKRRDSGRSCVSPLAARLSPGELARGAAFLAALLALNLGYGFAALSTRIPQKATLRATLVQQNTDPWYEGELPALASNIELARQALTMNEGVHGDPVDLVVFSETSLQRPFAEFRSWFDKNPRKYPFTKFLAESGAPVLTGAPIVLNWDTWDAMNAVILVSPGGKILGSYGKTHPVPFAEAIPFWEYSWFREFMKKTVGLESGWVMGKELSLFTITPRSSPSVPIRFGTPICFEDAFADLCRHYILKGADLLINLTNDSWSTKESAQIQHWAIARIRAIENRRTLVRSTNSGVSCVVDAWGKVIFDMPQFQSRALTVEIPVYAPPVPTVYTLLGEWFAELCTLLLIVSVVIDYVRFRRGLRCGELSLGER